MTSTSRFTISHLVISYQDLHLYTDSDTPISTENFLLSLVTAGFSYTCHWWNSKSYVYLKRFCTIDYGKLIRLRINKFIYELQENKHNSRTKYESIVINLTYSKRQCPSEYGKDSNEEILNILRVTKRYVTLTLFWKCRLFTNLTSCIPIIIEIKKNLIYSESCLSKNCGIFYQIKKYIK